MFRNMMPWTERLPGLFKLEREMPGLFERMFAMEEWPFGGEGFRPAPMWRKRPRSWK
jgi:hypothetical protein